ncbi:hypothetical protein [Streptomyces sp. cmx-4-9]|uniref:hypothetical protein n=1 Tax=Streptomyces sp. cmx-4-9 TaxID=2790941 RepID=UPI0039807E2D
MKTPRSTDDARRPASAGAQDDAQVRDRGAPSPRRLLTIYLNDHLAAAGSGVALARRMARAHQDTPAAPRFTELAREVSEDRDSLREVMTALDIPAHWSRAALGRLAEKAGRLKLNGRLVARSPLSDVLELEAMRLGIEGKGALWRSLQVLAESDARLDRTAMARLCDRAEQQAELTESLRVAAVGRTFTVGARTVRAVPARRHGTGRRAGWAS